ncbi:SRPBCC family protein [Streptomyces sp. NPDC091201]|uniref:SRPBCC family protein n=1 Tax=Streptomyces sp. NPDC091201 TaxID=3155190 RepID=UPI00343EDF82
MDHAQDPAPTITPTPTRTWELRESVIIAAPPEDVYAAISDVRRMPEWSPECVKVLLLRGRKTPLPTFIGFNRNGARRWFTVCRVTVAEAPAEFAFQVSVAGLPLAIWGFRIRPSGPHHAAAATGSTHVTQYWHDLRRGPLGAVADLLGRTVAGTSTAARVHVNRAGMSTTLHRLRDSLEDAAEGTRGRGVSQAGQDAWDAPPPVIPHPGP